LVTLHKRCLAVTRAVCVQWSHCWVKHGFNCVSYGTLGQYGL